MGQDPTRKEIDEATKKAELVGKYVQALEMSQDGMESKTPEFLLTAALMLRRMPVLKETEFDVEREVDGKPFKDMVKKPDVISFLDDSKKLLVEAGKLSRNLMANQMMTAEQVAGVDALAKRIGEMKIDANKPVGLKSFTDSISPKGVTHITIPYIRGAAAGIAVRSYGQAPLEVSVWQGNSLVSRYTGMVVQQRWTTQQGAKGPQMFKITIKSLGKAATPYQLFSN